MTNQLAKNPLLIDTANTTDVLLSGFIKINHIEWYGYANDNNNCEVCDGANMVIWQGNGHTDLSPVTAEHEFGWIKGLKVTKLDGGKLSIFFQ